MGHFDSDTPALAERAALNASRTEHDLEAWIFEQVDLKDGMRVLDLGCGTGKQLFALAARLSKDTEIIGVDISRDAVSEVSARAEAEGYAKVRAVCASLDDCPEALPGGQFDLVLSSYAIYYASDLPALLERLAGVLDRDGEMFLCGPGAGTNSEMITLVNQFAAARGDDVPAVQDFLAADQVDALSRHYRSVSTSRMENTVTFKSPTEVMTWWRNHNMHRPAVDEDVQRAVDEIFASASTFRLTKNVLGVHARA